MKNIKHVNPSNTSQILRMLVREIINERVDVSHQSLDYGSITTGIEKKLPPVQIQLPDTVLSITPVILSLDVAGLSNMVTGTDVLKLQRPTIIVKMTSTINFVDVQLELMLDNIVAEVLTLKGRGIDYSDNLYGADEFENLVINMNGSIFVDEFAQVENQIDQQMSITNLIDPKELGGDAGYIVELIFDIKKETVKFTPGKIMPRQNTYAAVYANPGLYDVKISPTGMRMHPIDNVLKYHYGQDITRLAARTLGQDIVAVLPGVVIESGVGRGFGNTIAIKHDEHGNIATRYSHMQNVSDKLVGSRVSIGEAIGNVGNTGKSKGPHLHFTVFSDASTYNNETTAGDPPVILANYPDAVFPITVEMPKK